MKRIIYITILFVFITSCKDKANTFKQADLLPDSLSLYFAKADNTALLQTERIASIQKASILIQKQKQDSLYLKNLFKIANLYYNMGEMESYKTTSEFIKQKAYQINDSSNIAKAYSYLGDYYKNKSSSDSAYLCYTKAEKIYKQLKDQENTGKVYLNKAFVFYKEGDFLRAHISVFDALSYFPDRENNKRELYETYNLIGVLFYETKEYEEAIHYYIKALNSIKNSSVDNRRLFIANTLNNLGVAYRNLGKNQEAIAYYQEALQEKGLNKEIPSVYAMLLDNLAYSQLQLQEYSQLPELFYNALQIRDSLQIIPGIVINKLHLSEYYQQQKDTAKAIQYASEAYTTAKEKGIDPRDILLSLKQLNVVHPSGSEIYSTEYTRISDSLKRMEPLLPDKMIQAADEAKDLAIQKAQLEERNKNRIIGFTVLILGMIVVFFIFYQKAKNKETKLKLEAIQQRANEEIYELLLQQQTDIETGQQTEKKRIARELHDGIINKLVGIHLNLGALNGQTALEARKKAISYINDILDLGNEIREIAHDLDLSSFSGENNFKTLLETLIETQKGLSETNFSITIDPDIYWDTIKNSIKINLYRTLQEALYNIHKYARAKNSVITVFEKENQLEVIITDDGIGFDTEKTKKGIGLKNMKTRVKSLKGTIQIISKPEKGTSIYIVVPINF